jgi:dephospho-CoA kinase
MSDRTSPATVIKPPRVIGLTGGIGMGKTTISNYLASVHGLPVLDADVYAREAVQSGSVVLKQITDRYGSLLRLPDGSLDRVRLGEIVFSSPAERHWLEQQIHPYVRDRMVADLKALAEQHQPVAVVVVPLLFEARMTDLATEIWVVHCSREQQIERMVQRESSGNQQRQVSLEQIHARIESQMPIEQKLRRANMILDNSSTEEGLFQQIDRAIG